MLVRSERLGDLDIDTDKQLVFDEGLLGFPDARQFVIVEIEESDSYLWLQSLDDPGLAFLAVVPWPFFPEYEPVLDESVQTALGLVEASDAIVVCLVTIRDDDAEPVTANLLGPIVINTRTQQGRQVVLADSGYPTRAALVGA